MKNSVRNPKQVDDTLDIPAEVDFSGGERGRYAHRFGEEPRDEKIVAQFLCGKGFEVIKIDENRFAKTPDFRLLKQGEVVAYCEVKTFERDAWLDKMLETVKSGELAGGIRPDPIANRISNAIHTAARQLECANPKHECLNVLVLVNHDRQAIYKDLLSVVSGKWDPLEGIHAVTHAQFSEGRIREEKNKIDLYIWLDALSNNEVKERGYFFGYYENRNKACLLFGIDASNVRTIA